MKKRMNYISWDDYFLGIAELSAARSKDPNTQVGACIVSEDNKILSVGYNGMPTGCNDDEMPWGREGEFLDTKYPYVCHAELNAILNSNHDLKGSRIYVSLFPCNECAKAIIQSGIKEVVYTCDKYADTDGTKASKMMFQKSGVKTRQIKQEHLVKILPNIKPKRWFLIYKGEGSEMNITPYKSEAEAKEAMRNEYGMYCFYKEGFTCYGDCWIRELDAYVDSPDDGWQRRWVIIPEDELFKNYDTIGF